MRLNHLLISTCAALALAWPAASLAQPTGQGGGSSGQSGQSGQGGQGGSQDNQQQRHRSRATGGAGHGGQGQGGQGQGGQGQGGQGQGGQGQGGQGQGGQGQGVQGQTGQGGSHGTLRRTVPRGPFTPGSQAGQGSQGGQGQTGQGGSHGTQHRFPQGPFTPGGQAGQGGTGGVQGQHHGRTGRNAARPPSGWSQLGPFDRLLRGADRDRAGQQWRGEHHDWDHNALWRQNRDWWRRDRGFRFFFGPRLGYFFIPDLGYVWAPPQYLNRYWKIGDLLPNWFWRYQVQDYWRYGLPEPPDGCAWVWVDDDVALVDLDDGYILDIVHNVW